MSFNTSKTFLTRSFLPSSLPLVPTLYFPSVSLQLPQFHFHMVPVARSIARSALCGTDRRPTARPVARGNYRESSAPRHDTHIHSRNEDGAHIDSQARESGIGDSSPTLKSNKTVNSSNWTCGEVASKVSISMIKFDQLLSSLIK